MSSKLKIDLRLLAVVVGFAAAFGWTTVVALVVGYIFLFESEDWLREFCGKVVKLVIVRSLIGVLLSLFEAVVRNLFINSDIFSYKIIDAISKFMTSVSTVDMLIDAVFTIILIKMAYGIYKDYKGGETKTKASRVHPQSQEPAPQPHVQRAQNASSGIRQRAQAQQTRPQQQAQPRRQTRQNSVFQDEFAQTTEEEVDIWN